MKIVAALKTASIVLLAALAGIAILAVMFIYGDRAIYGFREIEYKISHPAIWFSVCLLAVALSVDWKKATWPYRTLFACACFIFIYGVFRAGTVAGYDYEIYSYNAKLTLAGKNAFIRPEAAIKSPQSAHFLDYTGAQHGIYVLCEKFSQARGGQTGYVLWLLVVMLGCAAMLALKSDYWALGVLAFHPIFARIFFGLTWEDKATFILIPVLISYLIERRKLALASVAVGITLTSYSLTVVFLPIFLIFLYREQGRQAWKNIALTFTSAALMMLPYFPDSLHGWSNRSALMSASTPTWFTYYRLLPAGIYSPSLNKAMIGLASLAVIGFYATGRISIIRAFIFSLLIVTCMSSYASTERMVPTLFAIMAMLPGLKRLEWGLFSLSLSAYYFIELSTQANITAFQIVIFHLPLLLVLALMWTTNKEDRNLLKPVNRKLTHSSNII